MALLSISQIFLRCKRLLPSMYCTCYKQSRKTMREVRGGGGGHCRFLNELRRRGRTQIRRRQINLFLYIFLSRARLIRPIISTSSPPLPQLTSADAQTEQDYDFLNFFLPCCLYLFLQGHGLNRVANFIYKGKSS